VRQTFNFLSLLDILEKRLGSPVVIALKVASLLTLSVFDWP
jgi:hypothetical protein